MTLKRSDHFDQHMYGFYDCAMHNTFLSLYAYQTGRFCLHFPFPFSLRDSPSVNPRGFVYVFFDALSQEGLHAIARKLP